MRLPQVLYRLGTDIVAWYCVPAVFLFIYVNRYVGAADAVVPHLRLVTLMLLGLTLVRLILSLLIPGQTTVRLAASIAASALLAIMIVYYCLVLIGLDSWGRVISWELMASYSGQAFRLADALGISVPFAIAAAVLGYLGLLALVWIYLKYFDWTPLVKRIAPVWLVALTFLSGSMVGAIELYSFLAAPSTQESEPVSLTFFPSETATDFQFHAVDRLSAAKLDAIEDAARASYNPGGAARRNLILIVVDALRPDHMGIYGYQRDTTPNLSRLDRAGMLRKAGSVRASCSSSVCGLLSISSSKFVHQFSERPFTLHEVLKRHGYRVHMILSGDHTGFYGLRKAYGEVDSYFDGHGMRYFKYMNDDRLVLDHLAAFPAWDGVPVMMHFHLMSAHALAKRENAATRYAPSANYWLIANRTPDDPSERGVNFYDNGVVQADANIRELLEVLDHKGYLGNAVVAITADHGEALGEHGYYQHANSVREEVLRVPFMVVSYGYRPTQSIDRHVIASQVDIAPTLLAELNMPRPHTWIGAPLHVPVTREFTYFQQQSEVGLYDHRDPASVWKYWVNTKTGEEYAFNLSLDPKESRNTIVNVPLEQKRAWRLQTLAGSSVLFRECGELFQHWRAASGC